LQQAAAPVQVDFAGAIPRETLVFFRALNMVFGPVVAANNAVRNDTPNTSGTITQVTME
jgi:hypothetical protein